MSESKSRKGRKLKEERQTANRRKARGKKKNGRKQKEKWQNANIKKAKKQQG